MELRVDLLARADAEFAAGQLAALRLQLPHLPVLWTVRSRGQGGRFPDGDGDAETRMFALLEVGVREGCEFIDVEGARVGRDASGLV